MTVGRVGFLGSSGPVELPSGAWESSRRDMARIRELLV
jgi:hypothetical protein